MIDFYIGSTFISLFTDFFGTLFTETAVRIMEKNRGLEKYEICKENKMTF